MCRHLFYPFLPRRRGGLHALERRVSQLEQAMSDTKSQILAKLEALQAQVNEYTTDRATGSV
jgi:BMFP domain-containing protein YqiC